MGTEIHDSTTCAAGAHGGKCRDLRYERTGDKTHGKTLTTEYRIWQMMKQRCGNPNYNRYKDYGARGIKVCERWATSFENFYADMGPRPLGKSLDRYPDPNGNYEPFNCRWATPKQQQRNSRGNRWLTHNGKTLILVEWASLLSLKPKTISNRLSKGWSVQQALSTPVGVRRNTQ